jgi:hypothetical protein
MAESCTCSKCGKTMDEKNFYTYKDGKKTELCKKCLTMHIDNFDESTFLWLLEQMDVPYLPEEWNVLRDRAYAKDPYNMNGMSVFGKYLSKMKLKQWKQFGWADTEKLQAQNEEKRKAAIETQKRFEEDVKKQYGNGEISEAQYKTLMSTETQNAERPVMAPPPKAQTDFGRANFYDENNFMSEEELIDPAAELTAEDKLYLAMKWGRLYKPNEWVDLEKKYNEMMNSFDIQDSDTTGTLILICKTYLKMNQAIDCGDMDGYQKLSRVYDSLRKSAKFTAAQNKEQKSDYVDSVGELVAMCEKQGFIPRYATDIPQDKVDATLKDMNNYVYKLVTQDLGFGQQIEDALKKIQIQKEMEEDELSLEDEDDVIELDDDNYEQFYNDVAEQKEKDMKVIMGEED